MIFTKHAVGAGSKPARTKIISIVKEKENLNFQTIMILICFDTFQIKNCHQRINSQLTKWYWLNIISFALLNRYIYGG